jgi:hypothetical protein
MYVSIRKQRTMNDLYMSYVVFIVDFYSFHSKHNEYTHYFYRVYRTITRYDSINKQYEYTCTSLTYSLFVCFVYVVTIADAIMTMFNR